MSIHSTGGKIMAEFKPSSVQGTPMLGAYLLRFFLDYKLNPWDVSYRFSNARARVALKDGQLLGIAAPDEPFVLTSRGHPQEGASCFNLVLNANQVEAVEKIRLGGELTFVIDIYGEMFDGQGHDFRNERIPFPVNQKAWIDVLKAMNFSSAILVELPLSAPMDPASAAWKALGKAKEHLYYGNYDEVVAACRVALEGIQAPGEEVAESLKGFASNRREMTKQQRLVYALSALEHYSHPSHHVQGIEAYNRNDAIFMLGATISAVSTHVRMPLTK